MTELTFASVLAAASAAVLASVLRRLGVRTSLNTRCGWLIDILLLASASAFFFAANATA